MKPQLEVDREDNLVEQLRGSPEKPEETTTRTIERLNWRLTDRIARLLTTLLIEKQIPISAEAERDAYDVLTARAELHEALFDLRCYGTKSQQPEAMRPPKSLDSTIHRLRLVKGGRDDTNQSDPTNARV